ncbi:MAG: hypothetical protein LQ345_007073, partial [Seirophora villosa]
MKVSYKFRPRKTEILIFLRLLDGTEIPIEIDRHAWIFELRNRTDSAGGMPPGQKQLFFGDKKLFGGRLSDHNIKNDSIITLLPVTPRAKTDGSVPPETLVDAAGYMSKYAEAIASEPSKLRPADTDGLVPPGTAVDAAGYKSKREAQAIVGEPTKLRSSDIYCSTAFIAPTDSSNYGSKSTDAAGIKSRREAQATAGDYNGDLYDYDEDLYIVDPQSHFGSLKQLEQDVLRRSEYFKTKRSYSVSNSIVPLDDDGAVLDELGLEVPLDQRRNPQCFMASK